MPNVDGDITLRVDVTPGDVKSVAEDIKRDFEDLFKQTSSENLSAEFNRAKVSAVGLYDEMSKILTKMDALETATFETDQFKALSEEFDKTDKEYNELVKTVQGLGIDPDSNHVYRDTMDEMLNKLEELQGKMDQMRTSGTAFYSGVDTAEYDALTTKLNAVTNKASILRDKLSTLGAEFTTTATAEVPVINSSDGLRQKFSELVGNLERTSGSFSMLMSLFRNIGSGASTAFSAVSKFGSGLKTAISAVTRFGKAIKSATTHTRHHNNALQVGFKNFIRYGLGVRSVFALLNKMRRALGEGFENLAQYSPEFNSVMSQFVSALETVKNAFATAFAPILSVVIPILDTLMTALINVITLIGKFFAALSGKGLFVQAKRVNKDYAASLNKTAKSAGGASKGIDSAKESAEELKKTIAGFDDVEILHEDKPSSSGGSGGSGGGGGGGVGDILPSDMFETVAIDSPIANLANRMRELIANQDWKGLGAFLGEQINIVFAKAKQLISWDNLGERITFIVTAITETFNSLVDTIDWNLIGSTIAEGVNTVINTVYLLVHQINWGNLGKSLIEGLNGLIQSIDWRKLGNTVSEGILGVIDFIGYGIANFDWSALGRAILNFLLGIDWVGIIGEVSSAIFRILGSALREIVEFAIESLREHGGEAINGFLDGLVEAGNRVLGANGIQEVISIIFEILSSVITEAGKYLLENGDQIIAGLLEGMINAIDGIGQWIYDNIFTPFIEGIKGVFEIHSPSEVMKELGGYIIEGLFEGIKEALSAPGKWIKDNIFEPFIEGFESAFQIKNGSNSKSMSKEGRGLVSGLQEGVNERWSSIKAFFTKSASGISDTFKNTDWKGGGSNIVTKLRSGASGMWSTVSSFFSAKTTETRNQFTRYDWKPGGTAIVSGIKAGVQSVWNSSIGTYFDTAITGIKNKFNNADWKTPGKNVSNGIKNGIDAGYSSVVSSAGDLVWGIKNKFDTSWYNIGYNVCSGISSGIYGGTWKVLDAASDLAEDLKSKLRSNLKINSPSKVMRDLIGKAIPEGIAAGIEAESGMALKAVSNLSNSIAKQDIPQLQIPAVALGEIIPPEVGKNVDTLNETVKALLDVIKYNQSNTLTREDIMAVLNDVLPSMLQQYVSFYIGDEQIARHANAGNVRLDYRFNPIGR